MRKAHITLIVVLAILCCLGSADAVMVPFKIFTNNGQYNDNPGAIFKADVTDGGGTVNFRFFNESTFSCVIAAIYFDDGTLLGIDQINDGPGTYFLTGGTGNLPGAHLLSPPFVADREFNIGAANPAPKNGVNSIPDGEWVQITFRLADGGTFQNVLDELESGQLRIGLHITSFPDGTSESAVNNPEPATIGLLLLGSLVLLRKRR